MRKRINSCIALILSLALVMTSFIFVDAANATIKEGKTVTLKAYAYQTFEFTPSLYGYYDVVLVRASGTTIYPQTIYFSYQWNLQNQVRYDLEGEDIYTIYCFDRDPVKFTVDNNANETLKIKIREHKHFGDYTIPKGGIKQMGDTYKAANVTCTCKGCEKEIREKNIYWTLSDDTFEYNGKNQRPVITVDNPFVEEGFFDLHESSREVLGPKAQRIGVVGGDDYVTEYEKINWDRQSIEPGVYRVTIQFEDFNRTLSFKYRIVPKGTEITKLTPGKKAFAIEWEPQTEKTTAYEVRYGLKKKLTSDNSQKFRVQGADVTNSKASKLKAGTTYYVQVRTVVENDLSGNVYSDWSKVKKVTTKKAATKKKTTKKKTAKKTTKKKK
ncbi:MAG: fibronectin type III domain-containing protein [Clostridia bacterium]|nr:fibronectin type III domain-containing protein [Clostridia bacterium]